MTGKLFPWLPGSLQEFPGIISYLCTVCYQYYWIDIKIILEPTKLLSVILCLNKLYVQCVVLATLGLEIKHLNKLFLDI